MRFFPGKGYGAYMVYAVFTGMDWYFDSLDFHRNSLFLFLRFRARSGMVEL
ncbi:hypothetical protein Holit_01455 [Hollandina sp. SP2]